MEAVTIEDLVVSYGQRTAVDGLSLTVTAGTICVVLGPNGAGKTTTMSALLGLRKPSGGSIRIFGESPGSPAARAQIGVMLQESGLPMASRPQAIIEHFARLYADPLPPQTLMTQLALTDLDRPFKRLSGGEQQRVKLAVALIGRPRLLILDEPTSGMDPAARRSFWTLLSDLRSQGTTTLLTTHQPDEVASRADQIAIIQNGSIVADASPEAIIEQAPVWFTCARHLDLTSLRQVLGDRFEVLEVEPGRYRVHGQVGVPEVSAIRSWVAGHGDGSQEVTVVRSLEEAYLHMTGGDSW